MLRRTPLARAADSGCPKNASHTRPGEGEPFHLAQLLGQVYLIESHVPRARQRNDGLPGLLVHGIRRHLPSIPMRQCRYSPLPVGGQYPADMSRRHVEHCRSFPDRECSSIHFRDHQTPLLFLSAHCHVLHNGHFR